MARLIQKSLQSGEIHGGEFRNLATCVNAVYELSFFIMPMELKKPAHVSLGPDCD